MVALLSLIAFITLDSLVAFTALWSDRALVAFIALFSLLALLSINTVFAVNAINAVLTYEAYQLCRLSAVGIKCALPYILTLRNVGWERTTPIMIRRARAIITNGPFVGRLALWPPVDRDIAPDCNVAFAIVFDSALPKRKRAVRVEAVVSGTSVG